ncbi:MAG: ATP-binding protein [Bryobacterales bacterium]|nr:ATP-binding protein [Bryobacterales bacterium]
MRSSTGRWVSGDDFFGRDRELRVLEARVRDGNHVLLTGQRRMGKTSIARELGRRLECKGWVFLFTDIEGATCAEEVVASVAEAAYPVRSISSRLATVMRRRITESVDEVSALDFKVKIRAGLNAGSWRTFGEKLLGECATHRKPVLLVLDELPIFLKRILREPGGERRVDEFLSWLRGALQHAGGGSLSLIVSGSIGLRPLVHRLGIPDRINYLDSVSIGPWDRETSVKCFLRLAASHDLLVEKGVAEAVYDALSIGIPHQVQSFFARLRDFAVMHGRGSVTVASVGEVYARELLGPRGQSDLVHYETRLRAGLGDGNYSIAMEILAEAATRGVFTRAASSCLGQLYAKVLDNVPARISDTLEVLEHDGYLKAGEGGHRFQSCLLQDWWSARFRDHYAPLRERSADERWDGSPR